MLASRARCASALPRRLRLTLLDTVVIASESSPPDGRREPWFGSLSGLARDPRTGRYLPPSSTIVNPRASPGSTFPPRRSAIGTPGEVVPILAGPGIDPRLTTNADLEAIVALPDGTWVASEEGHDSTGEPGQPPRGEWPPALLTLQPDFTVTQSQPWPLAVHARPGVRRRPRQPGLRGPDPHAGRPPHRRTRAAAVLRSAGAICETAVRSAAAAAVRAASSSSCRDRRRLATAAEWVYPISRTPAPAGFETDLRRWREGPDRAAGARRRAADGARASLSAAA